jgi:hypothetical protein
LGQSRGATQELIDALPTYKFKPKRNKNWVPDHASSSENPSEGGILGPGTKKERIVSAEDAVSISHPFLVYDIQHYGVYLTLEYKLFINRWYSCS